MFACHSCSWVTRIHTSLTVCFEKTAELKFLESISRNVYCTLHISFGPYLVHKTHELQLVISFRDYQGNRQQCTWLLALAIEYSRHFRWSTELSDLDSDRDNASQIRIPSSSEPTLGYLKPLLWLNVREGRWKAFFQRDKDRVANRQCCLTTNKLISDSPSPHFLQRLSESTDLRTRWRTVHQLLHKNECVHRTDN